MKTIQSTIVSVMAVLSFSAVVWAADSPESIVLPASKGNVTFPHQKHQETLKDCTKCHSSEAGGTIEGFGKDIAHKTCKGCHSESGKGPTSCSACHVQ
jgi:cytochrome c553